VTPFRPDLLAGRVALITGGGTGICRGIALALAAHGCDVAVTSRRLENLQQTVRDIEALGRRSLGVAGDVRSYADTERVVREVADSLGGLDILVNGAAGNFVCRAENLSSNGFSTVVDIDLKGTFNVSRAAFSRLKDRHGTILNISGTAHYLGTIGQAHASAAKAGVDSLTRTLAVEWGPAGVRVNGLAPGPTEGTEGVRRLSAGPLRERAIGQTPVGRLATIEDVANAAVFLCSDAASMINGSTLVIDGGLWLRSGRMMMDDA
jgi:peroxisomal 2,4-dienoyl-CoA reductase